MSLFGTSPDRVPSRCTTPVTPRTDRCPDAPLGAREPNLYYPHPRRSSSPNAKRRDRSKDSKSPRQIRPAPSITAMSLFTSFAFAEVEKETNAVSRSCPPKPIRRRLNKYSSASELECALGSVCLNEQKSGEEHELQEYSPRSVKTKRMRDLIEVDQNASDHEDCRVGVGHDEKGVFWKNLSLPVRQSASTAYIGIYSLTSNFRDIIPFMFVVW
ncbi:uncharacterized protein MELLADRAFT_111420 [Melampsora larici-populina 98AG31]|uniref:Uncharacterized protein n=1 Tax=Melampsora larici-populina (strain 98AG31 / pathotype 3-4-7) TaxID=747676 RepID=F4S353_MELLP|nr:uncharacterized protein MELLADRAFT_111420 [Melampsora larici-populina 98AG31]EGG00968.1 hypothetical protein MELLADRAFT_111420 [Melampsora larici-populina 98AG31]